METLQTQLGQTLLERRYRAFAAGLLLLYAAGLTKDISEAWVGLHDWNGAFFSQLARNFSRYPLEIHHGMPVVAVGEAIPPAAERSIYATHPPGLVWMIAGAFAVFGESEAVARCLPILASLGTLALLLHLWRMALGRRMALLAGLFYACMPMSVYFGRMVNHEAIGLFLMLAAGSLHVRIQQRRSPQSTRERIIANVLLVVVLILGCWTGWAGCLFASLYCFISLRQMLGLGECRDGGRRGAAIVVACIMGNILLQFYYIVHAGLAGNWRDLESIFLSRATHERGEAPRASLAAGGDVWRHTIENVTWPLMILAAIGLAGAVLEIRHRFVFRNWASNDKPAGRGERASRVMLRLVSITGLVWLTVFYHQYVFHAYWAFFLGPAIAMLGAKSIGLMSKHVHATSRAMSLAALGAIVMTAAVLEVQGTWHYFSHEETALTAHVGAWQSINEMTRPADRIVTTWNPTWVERRGRYVFRNIVPPQFAYYADRAFTVEPDPAKVPFLAADHVLFVIQVADAVNRSGSLQPLRGRFSEQLIGDVLVVFRLKDH
ncbi:MAG: glycosyltransferase family 39 protein [Planctomycetes bacterium]|nr:glycosyltransferase family 39 protein [Planctomycetota bacterium]